MEPPSDPSSVSPAIRDFIEDWFRKLDVHASADEVAAMVSPELEMGLPEGPLHGREDFRRWYERVVRIFFDEEHVVTGVEVLGEEADAVNLRIVVGWAATYWRRPEPKSHRLEMVARQRWTIVRDPGSGKYLIRHYVVDALDPQPGSAPLPTA